MNTFVLKDLAIKYNFQALWARIWTQSVLNLSEISVAPHHITACYTSLARRHGIILHETRNVNLFESAGQPFDASGEEAILVLAAKS